MSNYEDFEKAVSHYKMPAQNFVFADTSGEIALWVSGQLPKKWQHQGRTVSDGTNPNYDWQGWIPTEHNPHIKNPERGFVSSANQESAAPDYPYYLDDDFAPYERGRRINERLGEMQNITPKDMQQLQLDNFAYNAYSIIPQLIEWTNRGGLNEKELEVIGILEEWDFNMDAEKTAPSVYLRWFNKFYRAVFMDEFNGIDAQLRGPARDIFVEIIKEQPDLIYVDNSETPERETVEDLATQTFKETISDLTVDYGENTNDWKWGYDIDNDIHHIANIPGFGALDLLSSGSAEAVNATRGTHGPSWRMVVQVGPEMKGWGVYPGGQSGNPGSPNYDNMLEDWRKGNLFELNFMKNRPADYHYKIQLNPIAHE
jgi:penicillin amidase